MLIVSQLKTLVINFDRLPFLGVKSLPDCSIGIVVYFNTYDSNGMTIGRYKDIIRAREVVNDILFTYEESNAYSSGFVKNDIYYMPKE